MPLHRKITMALLFHNGAVLQRDKPIVVCGTGEAMTSISGRYRPAWKTQRCASRIKGSPAVEVKELWVGEVWLANGQSNMQFVVTPIVAED